MIQKLPWYHLLNHRVRKLLKCMRSKCKQLDQEQLLVYYFMTNQPNSDKNHRSNLEHLKLYKATKEFFYELIQQDSDFNQFRD